MKKIHKGIILIENRPAMAKPARLKMIRTVSRRIVNPVSMDHERLANAQTPKNTRNQLNAPPISKRFLCRPIRLIMESRPKKKTEIRLKMLPSEASVVNVSMDLSKLIIQGIKQIMTARKKHQRQQERNKKDIPCFIRMTCIFHYRSFGDSVLKIGFGPRAIFCRCERVILKKLKYRKIRHTELVIRRPMAAPMVP